MNEDYKLSEKIAKATKEQYSKLQELNSDILQKFLNVVYFKKHEFDYAYIKDKTINKPKNYYLLNGKENKIEVAVNYHHEYKNYFTIDIY